MELFSLESVAIESRRTWGTSYISLPPLKTVTTLELELCVTSCRNDDGHWRIVSGTKEQEGGEGTERKES